MHGESPALGQRRARITLRQDGHLDALEACVEVLEEHAAAANGRGEHLGDEQCASRR